MLLSIWEAGDARKKKNIRETEINSCLNEAYLIYWFMLSYRVHGGDGIISEGRFICLFAWKWCGDGRQERSDRQW